MERSTCNLSISLVHPKHTPHAQVKVLKLIQHIINKMHLSINIHHIFHRLKIIVPFYGFTKYKVRNVIADTQTSNKQPNFEQIFFFFHKFYLFTRLLKSYSLPPTLKAHNVPIVNNKDTEYKEGVGETVPHSSSDSLGQYTSQL